MSVTPNPDDDDPTVIMRAPAVEATPATETRRLPADTGPTAKRPSRKRVLMLCVVAGIMFVVGMVGASFLLQGKTPPAVPDRPVQEAAAPPVPQPASPPAPPPSPSAPDQSFSPKQMLNEIFDGRDRGHSVTATVDKGALRISSTKPGYVYIVAAAGNQSDVSVLLFAVLFPRGETNNRIVPGQTMKLPEQRWPTTAEYLALVSDEPRDFGALGPVAGKVVCASGAKCSEAYGAVVFAGDAPSLKPGTRDTARRPAATTAPTVRPPNTVSRRCSDILERASLGESLTDEEQTFLRRDCR